MLGANTRLQPFLPALAALPSIDIDRIRKLGDYGNALLYWSATSENASAPKPELPAMIERAIALRERTLRDLRSLAGHGFLDESSLEPFGDSPAYLKVSKDLIGMAALVHERWSAIAGKSPLTLAAMDEASELGRAIVQALGDRDHAEAEKARDVVRRNKVYTLALRAYREATDGIAFLRRTHGDADAITPSIFAYLGTSPRKKQDGAAAGAATKPTAGTIVDDASDILGPKTSSIIVPDDASR